MFKHFPTFLAFFLLWFSHYLFSSQSLLIFLTYWSSSSLGARIALLSPYLIWNIIYWIVIMTCSISALFPFYPSFYLYAIYFEIILKTIITSLVLLLFAKPNCSPTSCSWLYFVVSLHKYELLFDLWDNTLTVLDSLQFSAFIFTSRLIWSFLKYKTNSRWKIRRR